MYRRFAANVLFVAVVAALLGTFAPIGAAAGPRTAPIGTPAPVAQQGRPAGSTKLQPGPVVGFGSSGAHDPLLDPAAHAVNAGRAARVVGRLAAATEATASPSPAPTQEPASSAAPGSPSPTADPAVSAPPDAAPSPGAPSAVDGLATTITGSKIYGTVKNQAGAVVSGITVTIYPQFGGSNLTTTTNSTGSWVVSVKGGGAWYVVGFHDPKGRYTDGYYSGGGLTTNANDTPVIVMYSTPRQANATLRTAYHITGHVQDLGAAPIVGLGVDLYTTTQRFVDFARTDGKGDYSVTVPAGSYLVYEADDLHARGCWSPAGPSGDWTTCTVYRVTTADIVLNMTVPPEPTLSGHLFDAATGLGMVDAVSLVEAPYGTSVDASGGSGADGAFSLTVQPGRYLLQVGGSVVGWYSHRGWTPNRADASPIAVTAAGTSGVDLTVPDWGTITGNVAGNGCWTNSTSVEAYDQVGYVNSVAVQSDGSYVLPVPAGSFTVEFFDPTGTCASGWYSTGGVIADGAGATLVVVTTSTPATASIVLPAPRWITGKLTYYGRAPDPTTVQVWTGSDFYLQTQTVSNGTFAVPVLPGHYTLFVVGAGGPASGWDANGTLTYASSAATVINATSANPSVSIALPSAGGAVSGHVTGPGGKAQAGIQVVAYANGDVAGWAITDASGIYTINLRAGTFRLVEEGSETLLAGVYRPGGFSPFWADATSVAVSSTVVTANFVVPVGHRLHGVVTGSGATGLHAVDVELFDNRGLYDYQTSGYGGELDFLLPGSAFTLGFYDPADTWGTAWYATGGPVRHAADATTLDLSAGDVLDLAIALPPITVPDPPTGVTGAGFDGGAVVTWTPPANDGWRPITGYTATAAPGGATCTSDGAARCLITGLTNGSPYTLTVIATNLKGPGSPSAPSDGVTPSGVPAPPTPVSAGGFHGGALVSWGASTTVTTTGYQVTSVPGGLTCSTAGATSCNVTGLTDGTPYTFTVVAVNGDGAGPASAATDPVIPALPTAAIIPLTATSAITAVTLTWRSPGNPNPATYDVRFRRAPWNGAFSGFTTARAATLSTTASFSVSPGSTYCYSVRAHDLANNLSAWSAETCTAVPLDDRSLTRSSGWTALAGSYDYRSTILRTTTSGAKLTRTGVVAKQVSLVVTTCPTCGTVRVYWGSTLLKTISLASSTTVHRKVITIATFTSARVGTVTIRVSTSGKPVFIDGLGVKRL